MYWFRLSLTVAACCLADKPASTSSFSQRRIERRGDMYFLQRQYRYIHLPLRSLRLCESKCL
jgi:hypothetical protein